MTERLIGVVLLVVVGLFIPPGSSQAATDDGFEIVGHHDLNSRGMNAGLGIAGDCGYIGSRSADQGTLILDLSQPEAPETVGEIPLNPGSTQREVRAVDALNLLVILNFRLDLSSAGPNSLDLYDIDNCREPEFRARVDFGESMPHEFFLWRDPSSQRQGRLLAYVTMWGHFPNLRIVDLTDPAQPEEIANWDAANTTGITSRIHSLTVSSNGQRAYIADWDNGIMVLDTSALARGQGDLTPILLTQPQNWVYLPGGRIHSAMYVPRQEVVLTTQEIYGPGQCPYGQVYLVDVRNPTLPVIVGGFGISENDPNTCGQTASLDGAFTTHDPLVVGNLAFLTWYAGGVRAIDLRDPTQPRAAGVFIPDPLRSVEADDFTLGSYPVRMWSSPIIRDGLIYVVDIRNGLYVLRYTGRGASTVSEIEWAEGNAS